MAKINLKRHITKDGVVKRNPKKRIDLSKDFGLDVSRFGFDPDRSLVHGTSYEKAKEIQRSKVLTAGTFVPPFRGGFEDARNWAKNVYGERGVVLLVECAIPINRGFMDLQWITVGSGREERREFDIMYDEIPISKSMIFRIEGNKLTEVR